ncbi:hypothetical protein [Serinibacter salmoneus]|uniref:Uncharacterized protein n=1 Tax=Serinibacter salmoneus TaxID=556530 RepID=A0A2A9D5L1_9MICO|nr:hypothetical protein [Serinibacter salmoneus]PFG21242.1 hypothetical protein ATL40_2865 [Serinibacter salmoneus]
MSVSVSPGVLTACAGELTAAADSLAVLPPGTDSLGAAAAALTELTDAVAGALSRLDQATRSGSDALLANAAAYLAADRASASALGSVVS